MIIKTSHSSTYKRKTVSAQTSKSRAKIILPFEGSEYSDDDIKNNHKNAAEKLIDIVYPGCTYSLTESAQFGRMVNIHVYRITGI